MAAYLKNNVFVLGILLLINILGSYFYFRVDLTNDKRYSISSPSKSMLEELSDQVIIKVYLDGEDLPGGFERLKRAVKETLLEFKYYGGGNVDFQFINPYQASSEEERNKLFKELVDKGMQPTNIFDKQNGKKTENLIFPYATVWFQGKESTVLLLKSNQAEDAQTKINQSYENVEYELSTAIKKLSATDKKKIGLLSEFTKVSPVNFAGLITSLQEFYQLYIIDSKASQSFEGLDALIVPKPDILIDENTKLKIDQFVMNGGKVLFFIDGLKVDSIGLEGTFAQPLDVNLDDLLFNYGLRINKNIVKDGLNATVIPLVVGNMGEKPNIQPILYRYFPLINNFGSTIITKNIDMVLTKFAASIDIVNVNDGIKKTPLLMTSPYTKTLNAPALITYNEARTETDEEEYQGGVKVIAYLLEGKFSSFFKGGFSQNQVLLKKKSENSKMLVVSDGDLIVNEVDNKTGNPFPMGYDRFSKHQYGNQDFVFNALNYLLDENGLIVAKAKSIRLRPLDTLKTRNKHTQWQVINLLLPLTLLVFVGLLRFYFIRMKYTSF